MEHEVFVPVPVPVLRRTLGDPVRVARCVPGLQRDAGVPGTPLTGRLRLRADGHTITYRGELRISGPEGPDGGEQRFSVTGEGVEARGPGAVELDLTVGLTATDGGTTLTYRGTAKGDGRLAELADDAVLAAAHRLLGRFTQQLVTESLAAGGPDAAGEGAGTPSREADGAGPAPDAAAHPPPAEAAPSGTAASGSPEPGTTASGSPEPGTTASGEAATGADGDGPASGPPESDASPRPDASAPDASPGADASAPDASPGADADSASGDASTSDSAPASAPASGDASTSDSAPDSASGDAAGSGSVFDVPVPPSSLDPVAGVEFTVPDEPPAEAAHARRTMIGRSAEEVDHAPPRGRYAPVPSPDAGGAGSALRWAAPAAGLVLVTAVVLGRALRRRR